MIGRVPYEPTLTAELRELATFCNERLGGAIVMGVARVGGEDAGGRIAREEALYAQFLAAGGHGSMGYLADHARMKFRPDTIVSGARSIIVVGVNYFQRLRETPSATAGRIARYAWGRDYHKTIGKLLRKVCRDLEERYPEESFRSFTDATPLSERHFAERAGVGFTGRNTLSISSRFGSWFLLGEIVTSLAFDLPAEADAREHGSCPSACRRCIDVCPTGALTGPHRIDASKCISYLTIENKGPIPVGLRSKMENWLFGCDLCQEVCPLNIKAPETEVRDFLSHRAGSAIELEEILELESDDDFVRRFSGSPLMRAGRRGLLRNACVVAGNMLRGVADARGAVVRPAGDQPTERVVRLLERHAAGNDEMIAEHARWALEQRRTTSARS